jgi:TonB family protein
MTARIPPTATVGVVLAFLACASIPAGAAQAVATLDELLARPLSPGTVALLVEHASDNRVVARWSEALTDPRPAVRAAAARAADVAGRGSLVPELSAALAAETDPAAAAEQAEALAAIGGAARDDELLAAARRQPTFLPAVARSLARHRGRAALAHADVLRSLSEQGGLLGFVELATRHDPAALTYAGAIALRERDEALLSAVLEASREAALDDGVLISGLGSAAPGLRRAVLWHLVLTPADPAAAVVEAADATPEAQDATALAQGRLAYEMVRRRLKRPPRPDPGWADALRAPDEDGAPIELARHPAFLRRLSGPELAALSERARGDARALTEWLREDPPEDAPPQSARSAGASGTGLGIPDDFPPGLLADLLQVSGCAPGNRQDLFHGAEVTYGPDGRPRRVTMFAPGAVPPGCVQAVKAMALLTLGPPTAPGAAAPAEILIVPLVKGVLACMAEPPPPPAAPEAALSPQRVGRGHIQEPKKLHHVAPWYPGGARDARIEGVVILEATIAPSGCVRSVKRLRSRDPRLDVVSLIAVAQWRYTPTLLNGVPVPVIMTVTVNFRLR